MYNEEGNMGKKTKITICTAIIALFFGAMNYMIHNSGTKEASRKQESYTIGDLSFYNDRILYVNCWGGLHITDYCRLVSYDPFTKESRIIHATNGFQGSPIYSWDGKKIAYANVELKRDASNICVMDADGSNQQQLTHDYNDDAKTTDTPTGKARRVVYNAKPSFSRDGKRIIFARASMKRQRIRGYGEMYTAWDIFEIDLGTKAIKQLTNYRFYEISRPFYLSDDKRFIFSGTDPAMPGLWAIKEMDLREDYKRRYQDNTIFIMDGRNNELKPAFTYGRWTSQPSVTKDDSILFLAVTNDMDGLPPKPVNYDLFLKKGGAIMRVTKNQGHIRYPSISYDGKRVFFNAYKEGMKNSSEYIVNNDGKELTEVAFPVIGPKKGSKVDH